MKKGIKKIFGSRKEIGLKSKVDVICKKVCIKNIGSLNGFLKTFFEDEEKSVEGEEGEGKRRKALKRKEEDKSYKKIV